MSYSKSISIVLTTFVCATALAVDAGARVRAEVRRTRVRPAAWRQRRPRGTARREPAASFRAPARPAYRRRAAALVLLPRYYYGFRPGLRSGSDYGNPYRYGNHGYRLRYGAVRL